MSLTKRDAVGWRSLLATGEGMLLTSEELNQYGHPQSMKHSSPTLAFVNMNRVSELTCILFRDASSDRSTGD